MSSVAAGTDAGVEAALTEVSDEVAAAEEEPELGFATDVVEALDEGCCSSGDGVTTTESFELVGTAEASDEASDTATVEADALLGCCTLYRCLIAIRTA